MIMANFNIDFNELVSSSKKTLFAGRANGRKAFQHFQLKDYDVKSNDILHFEIPDDIVISSSYFLGMLENILPEFDRTEDFYSHSRYQGKVCEAGMLKELDRAVERGLYKNEPFFHE